MVLAELKGNAEAQEKGTKAESDMASGQTSQTADEDCGGSSGTDGKGRERASVRKLEDRSPEMGAALDTK